MNAATIIAAAASLFRRLVLAAVEALNIPVSEPTMDALIAWEKGDKPLRARALPRLSFLAVASAARRLGSTRAAQLLFARAARLQSLGRLSTAPWPTEYGDHPQRLRLTQLVVRPRLVIAAAAFVLSAYHDGSLLADRTSTGHFGEQSPAVYKRHRTAFMRWLRFLRECVVPTISVTFEGWTQAGGYEVYGYTVVITYALEGRSHWYTVGARGELLWQPEPPSRDEYDYYEAQPEPEAVTCETCGGSGVLGTKDGLDGIIIKRGDEEKAEADGLELYDCDDCGGSGEVVPEVYAFEGDDGY